MRNSTIGFLVCLGLSIFFAALTLVSIVGIYNYGNQQEQLIVARYKASETQLTQFTEKVMEEAQIPDMYADKLQAVAKTAIQARYGEDGSKAMLQMIHEQNPTLDASVYIRIQNDIAAGRDDFTRTQNDLNDATRQYKTALGSFWTGTWLRIQGYPRIDLAKYDIVTSVRTDRIFDSKHDEVINLKGTQK